VPFSIEQLQEIFKYHPPTSEQQFRYQNIRHAALDFAQVIVANSPAGPDQTTAIRKLRECVMTANAAVALDGGPQVQYAKPQSLQ
jgi:hypothetical protein